MTAYYNEFDPKAAAWLRELIRCGHIAPGEVDERSIKDVQPDDLEGFTQCHFFAGIGVWSYALRRAGWADDRPVWTGSCPCQPFSAAGKGEGLDDPRHLWPDWFRLIRERRPLVVFGEQVAGKDGLAWLDLVFADLEEDSYTPGAVDTCSAGFGSPNIRQRLYWMADAVHAERRPLDGHREDGRDGPDDRRPEAHGIARAFGQVRGLADADGWHEGDGGLQRGGEHGLEPQNGGTGGMGDALGTGSQGRDGPGDVELHGGAQSDGSASAAGLHGDRPGPSNGFWRAADWLCCTDGRWRPVEPGTFPLVAGAPARLVRLRGYGNGLNAEVAQAFIEAAADVMRAA